MRPRGIVRRGFASRSQGFTLVELIMFIVIMGVVAVAMIQAFSGTMRGSHFGKESTEGTELAQLRMEVIVGQRRRLGYGGFDANTFDPCDAVGAAAWGAQACQTTAYGAGTFAITSNLDTASDVCGAGTGTNCKLVTVTVTSPYGGQLVSLAYQVWNY